MLRPRVVSDSLWPHRPPGPSSVRRVCHTKAAPSSLAAGRYAGANPVALSNWLAGWLLRDAACYLSPSRTPQPSDGKAEATGATGHLPPGRLGAPGADRGGSGSVPSGWPPAGHRLDGRQDGDRPPGLPRAKGHPPGGVTCRVAQSAAQTPPHGQSVTLPPLCHVPEGWQRPPPGPSAPTRPGSPLGPPS